jgi:hypothetical protein
MDGQGWGADLFIIYSWLRNARETWQREEGWSEA